MPPLPTTGKAFKPFKQRMMTINYFSWHQCGCISKIISMSKAGCIIYCNPASKKTATPFSVAVYLSVKSNFIRNYTRLQVLQKQSSWFLCRHSSQRYFLMHCQDE